MDECRRNFFRPSGLGSFFGRNPPLKRWATSAFVFAVKAPAGLSEMDLNFFPFTYTDGSKWAMSIYTVASSAWTSLAKEVETFRRHNVIGIKGLIFGSFEMTTLFKQKPGQEWFVPVVKLTGENPSALIEFLDAIK